MAGLVNWRKASIPGSNPDSNHVYVGVDSSDDLLYQKDSAGNVTKFPTLGQVAAAVLSTVLTGISFATSTAITATDTVLSAFGKLQAQLTTLFSRTISAGYGLTGGGNLSADRSFAVSLSATEQKEGTSFVTSSATDVVVTGLSSTPDAGTYIVMVSTDGTFDTNNRISTISIYVGGSQVSFTERSNNHLDKTRQVALQTQGIVTVNGSQQIDTRVRVSAGSLTIGNKSMILLRTS